MTVCEQLTQMKLHGKRMGQIGNGKQNTMRLGDKNVALGAFRFVATEDRTQTIDVVVTMVVKKRFVNLDMVDAYGGGYTCRHAMMAELMNIYPEVKPEDTVTIVWFDAI